MEKQVSRETLYRGPIVSIKVGKKARLCEVQTEEGGELQYLHWTQHLPGGKVNLHLMSTDLSLRGRRQMVEVELELKTTESGRQFIHVNLHPVKVDKPTHSLYILHHGYRVKQHWIVHTAHGGLQGYIAFLPPDEKPGEPEMMRSPVVEEPEDFSEGEVIYAFREPIELPYNRGNRPFEGLADLLKK